MDSRGTFTEVGIQDVSNHVDPTRLHLPEDDRGPEGAADGDGAMLGRVLVYASMIVVALAMVVWKRIE